jgi:protein tyrosine phosphatase (PTP) superfamily phosphohydrolase (DUF442 family)
MRHQDIFNFRQIDERLATAGQPSEDQLRQLAADGFEAVINIAAIDPRYSLDDEQTVVETANMHYWHLPVAWEAPEEQDFIDFVGQMDSWSKRKLLVHCAANYRVSAFYALYAMLRESWSREQANAFIAERWVPADYPPWDSFIDDLAANLQSGWRP